MDLTGDLESAQNEQQNVGEASSDPEESGPTENLREKAADMVDESEDSREPA